MSKILPQKYPKQTLISSAEALGYKKEVVAGALASVPQAEMTEEEAKRAIKDFLERKV